MRASPSPATAAGLRSRAFLLLFALGWAGGTIGYLPLLSLLLPLKVSALGTEGAIGLLARLAIAGAVAASCANILFGWLTDRAAARGGSRRRWAIGGLFGTIASYGLISAAHTPLALVLAVLLFQSALNALLAPLLALMATEIPDRQKGLAAGLMGLANPLAAAVAALALLLPGHGAPLAVVALAMAAAALPFLLMRPQPLAVAQARNAREAPPRRDLLIAFLARALVQMAGTMLAFYLLYYAHSIAPDMAPHMVAQRTSQLLFAAFVLALMLSVPMGRWSDRIGRRKPFLLAAAMAAAIGLTLMAMAGTLAAGAAGFLLYTLGAQAFLLLHGAFQIELLPGPRWPGRDLGLLNLANTLPAILAPLLAWWLATPQDFARPLLLLAGLTLLGGLMMAGVRSRA